MQFLFIITSNNSSTNQATPKVPNVEIPTPPITPVPSGLFTPIKVRLTSAFTIYIGYEPPMEQKFNSSLPSKTNNKAATPNGSYNNKKLRQALMLCSCRIYNKSFALRNLFFVHFYEYSYCRLDNKVSKKILLSYNNKPSLLPNVTWRIRKVTMDFGVFGDIMNKFTFIAFVV